MAVKADLILAHLPIFGAIWLQDNRSAMACPLLVLMVQFLKSEGKLGCFASDSLRCWPTCVLPLPHDFPQNICYFHAESVLFRWLENPHLPSGGLDGGLEKQPAFVFTTSTKK